MSDFTVNTTTTRKIPDEMGRNITLNAGEKLADDHVLSTLAQKTVPTGYRVVVRVEIQVISIEEV